MKINGQEVSLYREYYNYWKEGYEYYAWILWRIRIIKNASEDKTITSEYLLSYILPLFAFDFTKWDQVVLFLVFYLTLGYLCIRHNHFSVNVWLEILNYKMFTCELENEDNTIVQRKIISQRTLNSHKGEYVYLKSLNNEIKLDIEK